MEWAGLLGPEPETLPSVVKGNWNYSDLLDPYDAGLRKCVCPLWLKQGTVPEAVASSTLLEIGPERFAMTAAHVADYFQGHQIHVGNSEGFRPIVGDVNSSVPPDTSDTAFIHLHPEIASWLSVDYRFLSLEEVDVNDLPSPNAGYQFFGVPYRKVPTRPKEKLFRFPVYSYSAASVPDTLYGRLNLLPASHVAVDFVPRHVRDGTGRQITAPNPEGMSGGPIFRYPRSRADVAICQPLKKPLVALAVEHRSRVLIGVRVGIVLEAIRRANPEVAGLIPALPEWLKII